MEEDLSAVEQLKVELNSFTLECLRESQNLTQEDNTAEEPVVYDISGQLCVSPRRPNFEEPTLRWLNSSWEKNVQDQSYVQKVIGQLFKTDQQSDKISQDDLQKALNTIKSQGGFETCQSEELEKEAKNYLQNILIGLNRQFEDDQIQTTQKTENRITQEQQEAIMSQLQETNSLQNQKLEQEQEQETPKNLEKVQVKIFPVVKDINKRLLLQQQGTSSFSQWIDIKKEKNQDDINNAHNTNIADNTKQNEKFIHEDNIQKQAPQLQQQKQAQEIQQNLQLLDAENEQTQQKKKIIRIC